MIVFDCDVICDRCGLSEKTTLSASNVSDNYGSLISIHGWELGHNREYENWGFMWKPIDAEKSYVWRQKVFCPTCYQKEKELLPKRTFLDKVLG